MLVPVNELPYNEQYGFYMELRKKVLKSQPSCIPVDFLIEWDKVRLKLFPNARKQYAEVADTEGSDS